jgi:hypothetical protein
MRFPALIAILVTFSALLLAIPLGSALADGDYSLALTWLISALVLFAFIRPYLLSVLSVMLFSAGVYIPMLPGNMPVAYIAMAAAWVPLIPKLILLKRHAIPKTVPHVMLFLFCVVVVVTMLCRGVGFRFSGSGVAGGGVYIRFLIVAAFTFLLPLQNIKPRSWPKAIFAMGLLGLLPIVAEAIVVYAPAFSDIWMVIRGNELIGNAIQQQFAGGDMIRITSAGGAGVACMVSLLAIKQIDSIFSIRGILYWPLIAAFFIVTLYGGFRMGVISFLGTLAMNLYLNRKLSMPVVSAISLIILLAVVCLYRVAPDLPPNFQRTLTWLPGISVPDWVKQDAWGTIEWRLELWQMAWSQKVLPHLLLGEGLSYEQSAQEAGMIMAGRSFDNFSWALATGAYHNGPLCALIAYGVLGFVLCVSFLITSALRHLKKSRQVWKSQSLLTAHKAILSSYLVMVMIFFILFGDVSTFFTVMVFHFAMLEGLVAADQASEDNASSSKIQLGG